jgi:hypothetical protein
LHTEKAVDQLVRVIEDTDMGMRWDRVRWQALRNGEEEDAPNQFGEERPEDGVNEGRMGLSWDQEWLLERPDEERGGEEDIAREGEAGEAVEVEEN